jgi:hypothetical protein
MFKFTSSGLGVVSGISGSVLQAVKARHRTQQIVK